MNNAGYSNTPLAKKLGIKENTVIKLINQPENYFDLFSDFPPDVQITSDSKTKKDLIHYFTKSASLLQSDIRQLRMEIKENGMIWISWPKKASKIETNLNGNLVREIGLKNDLVDVKVCAVDDVWSGLKFVIRLANRRK